MAFYTLPLEFDNYIDKLQNLFHPSYIDLEEYAIVTLVFLTIDIRSLYYLLFPRIFDSICVIIPMIRYFSFLLV